jgi:2-amino-4-hydroxy-6-hydroxymethyldihydropteridine diphosphokinase
VTVAVALGSNLGDRRAHLDWAVDRLRRLLGNLHVSTYIDTAPVDVPDLQPTYLNAVATGETALEPRDLLDRLMRLEQERGRQRAFARAARTLDLDLILYGDVVVREAGLEIPHPAFRDRLFVLAPLAEIAPDMVDPVTGRRAVELLRKAEVRKAEGRGRQK